jgi:hypothetical protein
MFSQVFHASYMFFIVIQKYIRNKKFPDWNYIIENDNSVNVPGSFLSFQQKKDDFLFQLKCICTCNIHCKIQQSVSLHNK